MRRRMDKNHKRPGDGFSPGFSYRDAVVDRLGDREAKAAVLAGAGRFRRCKRMRVDVCDSKVKVHLNFMKEADSAP